MEHGQFIHEVDINSHKPLLNYELIWQKSCIFLFGMFFFADAAISDDMHFHNARAS